MRSALIRSIPAVAIAALALAGSALAQPLRQTTAQVQINPGGAFDPAKPGFFALGPVAGQKSFLRELPGARAQANRAKRRTSRTYFAAINDFQLADEESPARIDSLAPVQPNTSAWRPQEALMPAAIDATIRRVNQFTAASPNAAARGRRARMDLAIVAGDNSDNQQENENTWVRQLLEGGRPLDPNSGTADYSSCTPQQRTDLLQRPADEASRYTGLQDYADYNGGAGDGNFYDPSRPAGVYAAWPQYAGLMDVAQRPFVPAGLRNGAEPVPTYLANGNHDAAVQGYVSATRSSAALATGCFKPYINSPATNPPVGTVLAARTGFPVPPDPSRRFVDRAALKRIYGAGAQSDGHGYGRVDPRQNAASGGSASYYAWTPRKGLRFIALDTVSEGSGARGGAEGNLDDPQYQWLRGELRRSKAARQMVVIFGHHPIRRLIASTPDEAAGPCNGAVGCDSDPRRSSPIRLRADVERLLNASANVAAYFSGHSHVNRIRPCATRCTKKGNWWSIETTSVADWPQQTRLMELMDNEDGTLSLLGTPIDHAGAAALPPPSPDPATTGAFSGDQLASMARAFSYNDPRAVRKAAGGAGDRNVELVVRDPFAGKGAGLCAGVTAKTTGAGVNGAPLGRTRASVRRTVTKYALKAKSSRVDRYCLVGGGFLRVGFAGDRSVIALSSNRSQRLSTVKVGSTVKTVRSRLRGERSYRAGSFTWFVATASKARIVVQTRRGRVVQMGLADKERTSTRKQTAALLRGY